MEESKERWNCGILHAAIPAMEPMAGAKKL
jgi:hypothetical protein